MAEVNDLAGATILDRRTAIKLAGGVAMGAALGVACRAKDLPTSSAATFDEYSQHDGLGLAELVQKKDVKPEELLEAAIARTEAVNATINAVVVKCYDQARDSIKRGLPDGPFKGVPFVVKDLGFWMKDTLCTEGSRLFENHVAKEDDIVVRRYREAGLVIFGRTATPELGLLPITESKLQAVTRNPWNLEWNAGGSSGGTAAAVAAGIVPMGSAADGGGSIRIPASCCGLFGIKPTRARVPLGPRSSDGWGGLVVLHALTRSVRDSAALLDATCDVDAGAPYWAPRRQRPFRDEIRTAPGPLRIALVLKVPPLGDVHPECRKAAHVAARLCEEQGHRVDEVTDQFVKIFPYDDLRQAMWVPALAGLALSVKDRLTELNRELDEEDLEPATRSCLEAAKQHTAIDLASAARRLHQSSRLMASFLSEGDSNGYDLILSPTLAQPALKNFGSRLFETSSDELGRQFMGFCPYNQLANWTGQPAMSVPLHWTPDDLPVGVQFMGRYGDEATLFRLGAQLEQAQPWAGKRPSV